MADMPIRREVQRSDDPFGIPACFYWTVDEVADWIESIGYGKYKENFRSHFINGRKLLTIDACTLPKLGIVHFGDILALTSSIKDVLGKYPKVSWTPNQGPTCYCPHQQRFELSTCEGRDLDYNWRLWVPEFYKGYTPKESPVTNLDFHDRWYNENNTFKILEVPRHF